MQVLVECVKARKRLIISQLFGASQLCRLTFTKFLSQVKNVKAQQHEILSLTDGQLAFMTQLVCCHQCLGRYSEKVMDYTLLFTFLKSNGVYLITYWRK